MTTTLYTLRNPEYRVDERREYLTDVHDVPVGDLAGFSASMKLAMAVLNNGWVVGQNHPAMTGFYIVFIHAAMADEGHSIEVRLDYEKQVHPEVDWGSAVRTEDTNIDRDGTPMTTQEPGGEPQGHLLSKLFPQSVVRVRSIHFANNPLPLGHALALAKTYLGTLNAGVAPAALSGGLAGEWMMTEIQVPRWQPATSPNFDVEYVMTRRPETWNTRVIHHVDGEPVADPVPGLSERTYELYERTDFEDIPVLN